MNWRHWVGRWERMQERYVYCRDERFRLLASLIGDTQTPAPRILDLGCGPGSLIDALLIAFPDAQVWGIDVDPTLLLLGRERFANSRDRVRLVEADLRAGGWMEPIGNVNAIVSATALHWLTAGQLGELYARLAGLLAPGGVLLNADHAGSDYAALQAAWDHRRDGWIAENLDADDWDGFWRAYLADLGDGWRARREAALGPWEGSDRGMPLAWHLDALRAFGLVGVDCFWRHGGDAIYGGFKQPEAGEPASTR